MFTRRVSLFCNTHLMHRHIQRVAHYLYMSLRGTTIQNQNCNSSNEEHQAKD